ncbi:hypothetical protein JCM1840_002002 [Sporobolomyces johnsonii]
MRRLLPLALLSVAFSAHSPCTSHPCNPLRYQSPHLDREQRQLEPPAQLRVGAKGRIRGADKHPGGLEVCEVGATETERERDEVRVGKVPLDVDTVSLEADEIWVTVVRSTTNGAVVAGGVKGASSDDAEEARSTENVDFASQPVESPANSCTSPRANLATTPALTVVVDHTAPSSSTSETSNSTVSFAAASPSPSCCSSLVAKAVATAPLDSLISATSKRRFEVRNNPSSSSTSRSSAHTLPRPYAAVSAPSKDSSKGLFTPADQSSSSGLVAHITTGRPFPAPRSSTTPVRRVAAVGGRLALTATGHTSDRSFFSSTAAVEGGAAPVLSAIATIRSSEKSSTSSTSSLSPTSPTGISSKATTTTNRLSVSSPSAIRSATMTTRVGQGSAQATTSSSSTAAPSSTSRSTEGPGRTSSSAAVFSSSVAASAARAAASASPSAFVLPGRSLAVLPIGLGVFGGIAGLALLGVALVTYQRKRYRAQFRQRRRVQVLREEEGGRAGRG